MHTFTSIFLLHLAALIKAQELQPTPPPTHILGVRAIEPTAPGQIGIFTQSPIKFILDSLTLTGINPVDVYYQTTTMKPDEPVPSRPVIHDGATYTIGAPFAVVTEADGDIVFPVNIDSKPALQNLFEEVTAFCAGSKTKLRKRSGQCELDYLSRPGVGGGILEFDFPEIGIPTFTMGDISVALQSVPGAVAVAFLAYAIGDGKVKETVAPKMPKETPTPTSTSEKLVPTTTREDMLNSLFTADAAVYGAMAVAIKARIALGDPDHLWSEDQTEIPTPECNRDNLANVETSTIQDLSKKFCDNIDFTKSTSKDLKDGDGNTASDYKFNMKWEPKDGGECHNLDCEAMYSTFASSCSYNSHSMYTTGTISTSCGTASFEIKKPDDKEENDNGGSSDPYCTTNAECRDQPCPGFPGSCGTFGAPGVNEEGKKMCQCINPPYEDDNH